MAMKWDYPNTGSIKISAAKSSSDFLIPTDDESSTAVGQKTLTFKGFPTPEDNQDANSESSTYRIFTSIFIEKLFGIQYAMAGSKFSTEALIDGEPE